jgi:hypothetical protein
MTLTIYGIPNCEYSVTHVAKNARVWRRIPRFSNLAAAWLTSLAMVIPSHALAEPIQAKETDRRPPLRLTEPDWKPMTGQEIREKISDHSVYIDTSYEPLPGKKLPIIMEGGCPPRETFFRDGQWQIGICQRSYRVFSGRWSIELFRGGERLCVEGESRPKSCRFVWEGASADQIFMSFGSAPADEHLNDDFMPYRDDVPGDRVTAF